MNKFLLLTIISCVIQGMYAFTTPYHISTTKATAAQSSPFINHKTPSTTTLAEGRQWNFNDGRSPYGFKKNAEIWNGRAAQMAFTVVLLQELISGKGVVAGLRDGDSLGYVFLGLTAASVLGLSGWLAIARNDDDIQKTISDYKKKKK